jgi:hypothetical protein
LGVILVGFKSDRERAAEQRVKDADREAADTRRFDRPGWKIKDADKALRDATADLDRIRRGH